MRFRLWPNYFGPCFKFMAVQFLSFSYVPTLDDFCVHCNLCYFVKLIIDLLNLGCMHSMQCTYGVSHSVMLLSIAEYPCFRWFLISITPNHNIVVFVRIKYVIFIDFTWEM